MVFGAIFDLDLRGAFLQVLHFGIGAEVDDGFLPLLLTGARPGKAAFGKKAWGALEGIFMVFIQTNSCGAWLAVQI